MQPRFAGFKCATLTTEPRLLSSWIKYVKQNLQNCINSADNFHFQHVYDVMHSCDLDFQAPVSMNSARWLLAPGEGLVYGTNRGDLHVRRPGSVNRAHNLPFYDKNLFMSQCHCSRRTVSKCLLHCMLSLAVQCIVIGPVCGFVCLCGSVTTITRNCVHRSSTNWVCRWR